VLLTGVTEKAWGEHPIHANTLEDKQKTRMARSVLPNIVRLLSRIFGIRRHRCEPASGGATVKFSQTPAPQARAKPLHKKAILIAEASDDFALLLRRAFTEAGMPHMLRRVRDGAEALRYVAGQDEFSDRQRFPYPDLLVVGSVMPRIGGVELLGYVRGELGLTIPVVIFSHSLSPLEMRRALELGAADYLVCPDTLPVLVDEVNAIERTWLVT